MQILRRAAQALGGSIAAVPLMAHAVGEATGTEAVADMQISGNQLLMIVGGVVALGLVMWVVVKFLSK